VPHSNAIFQHPGDGAKPSIISVEQLDGVKVLKGMRRQSYQDHSSFESESFDTLSNASKSNNKNRKSSGFSHSRQPSYGKLSSMRPSKIHIPVIKEEEDD